MSCVEDMPYKKQAGSEVTLFKGALWDCPLLVALNFCIKLKKKTTVFREVCTWQRSKLVTTGGCLPALGVPEG